MTTRERIARMFEHRDADRVPIIDEPWGSTIERWHREGMPRGMNYRDYFDIDKHATIMTDISPRYPETVIEETDDYKIFTTNYGITLKQWKNAASTPLFLDHAICDPDSWRKAKERMTPSDDRIDWDYLKTNYKRFRDEGQLVQAYLWFGYDVTHSWTIGTERTLFAIAEEPEWLMDIIGHMLDMSLALCDRMWDAGYTFDAILWPDDMGYKNSTFFSLNTYREFLKPYHKKAIEWAHKKGIKAMLHSCGNINAFIPDFIEMGLDSLNPLEVKAGMDPVKLKEQYGDKLLLHGGINALLYEDKSKEAFFEEIKRLVPVMKENGGYIFATDHSIPDSVSLEEFREVVRLAKEYGSYE